MDFVFECVRSSNENGININVNEIETTSYFVHKTLEGLGCIAETKGHFGEFKETKWGCNGGFANVVFSHRDLVVSSDEVDRNLVDGELGIGRGSWHDLEHYTRRMDANHQVEVWEPCEGVKPMDCWMVEQFPCLTCAEIRLWRF